LEIRTRITELLVIFQSEISMGNEGISDSTVDFQAIVNDEPQIIMPFALDGVSPSLTPQELSIMAEPLAFQGQLSDLEYGPLGFASTLAEGVGLPIGKLPRGEFAICTTFP
jgi:hypothetical protein